VATAIGRPHESDAATSTQIMQANPGSEWWNVFFWRQMVAGFGIIIPLGALLTAFRMSQGEGKTRLFTPKDSVPLATELTGDVREPSLGDAGLVLAEQMENEEGPMGRGIGGTQHSSSRSRRGTWAA